MEPIPIFSRRRQPILSFMILRIRCVTIKGWQQLGMVITQGILQCNINETIMITTETEIEAIEEIEEECEEEAARTQTPQETLGHRLVIICVVQKVLTYSSSTYQIR